jgi:hypothetical protein
MLPIALLVLLGGSSLAATSARADTIVAWDEWTDGQLSGDLLNPTNIGLLGEGDNVVKGKVVGGADRFLFEVGAGLEILSAFVEITTFNSVGTVELSLTDFTLDQTLAVSALGTLTFDTFANAGAGTYLAQVYGRTGEDPRFRYDWHVEIGPAGPYTPNPEPGTIALVGAGALGLALRRRRQRRQAA